MNIGVIGTGARAAAYVEICMTGIRGDVHIKALSDINEDRMHRYVGRFFGNIEKPNLYTDYNRMLEDEDIDAVIICTPDATHREITIAALKKEKNVLLEKPAASTIDDSLAIYRESVKHNIVFRMGFVLRYTNVYKKIKEIVARGDLGQLISIEAKEMLDYTHGGSFFRRWHRFKENNGGFLNAKCSHDMDILNWLSDVDPVYVSAFGSRSYFNNKDGASMRCADCNMKNNCRYYFKQDGGSVFSHLTDFDMCVFNSDKNIVDHEVVNIEYENGLTACFTVTTLSAETSSNRTMVLFGTEATLFADFNKREIRVAGICPKNEVVHVFADDHSGHGGGDHALFSDFIDAIRINDTCANDARAGMMSSLVTLSAEISMSDKRVIDLRELMTNVQ
jgi:predicted dehydrogenase